MMSQSIKINYDTNMFPIYAQSENSKITYFQTLSDDMKSTY